MKRIFTYLVFVVLLFVILVNGCFAQAPATYQFYSPGPSQAIRANTSIHGSSSNATYYYFVFAEFPIGTSQPENPGTITRNSPNPLTNGNYITISWNGVLGATGYDVVRLTTPQFPSSGQCSNCLVVSNTSNTSINDTTQTLSQGYTLNTVTPVGGSITLDNQNYSLPTFVVRATKQSNWTFDSSVNCTNCGGGGISSIALENAGTLVANINTLNFVSPGFGILQSITALGTTGNVQLSADTSVIDSYTSQAGTPTPGTCPTGTFNINTSGPTLYYGNGGTCVAAGGGGGTRSYDLGPIVGGSFTGAGLNGVWSLLGGASTGNVNQIGVAIFSNTGTPNIVRNFIIPNDYSSNMKVNIEAIDPQGVTGNVQFDFILTCQTTGTLYKTTAGNTVSVGPFASPGTLDFLVIPTAVSIPTVGCAANQPAYLQITRNNTITGNNTSNFGLFSMWLTYTSTY